MKKAERDVFLKLMLVSYTDLQNKSKFFDILSAYLSKYDMILQKEKRMS